MKTAKRVFCVLLLLVMVCVVLPTLETSAAKNGYLSLEEAGVQMRQYMASRRTDEITIKVYIEEPRYLQPVQIYDLLLAEATEHTGMGNEGDALKWAWNSVGYDVTEEFDGTTHYINFRFYDAKYYSTAAQEQELNTKVQQIMAQLNLSGKTEYEKVFAIYDYVCKNVRYAEAVMNHDPNSPTLPPELFAYYSAYGALVTGEATCQGFSIAMYRLLLEAGIDNRLVDGDQHGWNIVKLGNLYYCLDATWDSDTYHLGDGNYKWFLKGASDFWDNGHTSNTFFGKESFQSRYPISPVNYGAAVTATGSGQCGDNATWALTADGTLTISGTGAMWEMNRYLDNWGGLEAYVKKIVIQNGITTIGADAFYAFREVTEVSIPNTVTSIGQSAFGFCTKLSKVHIPNSVTGIGTGAFSNCWSLKDVTLPSGLTELPYKAFTCCLALENITLPSSLHTIGSQAFAGCQSLKGITIPASVKTIGAGAFDSAFDPDANVKVIIPSTVSTVGDTCFAWSGVQEVIWESTQTKLESMTFYLCYYLKKVTLPDHITEFGDMVFQECNNLKTVKLPSQLKKVGIWTFLDCQGLESIQLSPALSNLSDSMFLRCYSLKDLVIPNSVTEIGNSALEKCMSLKEITVPASVKKMGTFVFWDSDNLQTVTFLGDAPEMSDIFRNDQHVTAYYPGFNPTWTADKTNDYGNGTIKWIGYHSASQPHVMETTLRSDAQSHWYQCSGCDYKENVAAHIYNGCEENCQSCGYYREVTHNFQWQWNEEMHWRNCACGMGEGNPEAHSWNGDTCGVCGATKAAQHQHTMSTNWITDENGHWKQCTDCGHRENQGDHYYTGSCDTDCDICGYYREVTHNFHWCSSNDLHWKECACGARESTPSLHSWNNGTCADCGAVHSHTMDGTWSSDNSRHWHSCSGCDYKTDIAEHRYAGNCDTTCEDCGYYRTVSHDFQWKWNDEQHWRVCDCGVGEGNPANHTWVNNKCSACGADQPKEPENPSTPDSSHTHTIGSDWRSNSQQHWHQCTGCSYKEDAAAHGFANSCDAICDDCGYYRAVSHDFKWQWNEEQHWKVCDCGVGEGSPVAHSWADRTCSTCGAEKAPEPTVPNDPTEPPTEPSTQPSVDPTQPAGGDETEPTDGSVWAILAGVALVAAGGAAAAVVLLKKKK